MGAHVEASGEGLLDRGIELGLIERTLASAVARSGSILLFEGAGGIGKTRLVLAARQQAHARGMIVASARGTELERQFAFGVVRQLLEQTVAGEPESCFEGAARQAAAVFDAPPAGAATTSVEPSFAVLHGLHWLCANVADRAPLLLAVDDAHWADLASLEFLAYLARRVEELPIALVIATRPAEESSEARLLDDLRADPATSVVHPAPLGHEAIAALVREEAGRDPDEAFVEACRGVTEGNPFLVRELAHELREREVEPTARSASRVAELGPRGVARRLLGRVRSVSHAAAQVAWAVAVLGADAQVRHVATLAGVEPEEAAATIDRLALSTIVTAKRPVEFVHPIVRSAIYADIPAGDRARLHALAVDLLEREGAPDERVASHLLVTEPAGDPRTVRRLLAVAREALGRGAPRSAVSYLRRALAEPPPVSERAEVLAELGAAEALVADERAVEHLREALESSSSPVTRRAAAVALGRFLVLTGHPGRASDTFETALAHAGESEFTLQAAVAAAGVGDVETASVTPDRLRRLRERVEVDPDPPAGALTALAISGAQLNEPAEQVAQLCLRALATGGPRGLGWVTGLQALFSALLFAERYDAAADALDEGMRIARERGSLIHAALCYGMRCCLAFRRGALADAEADGHAALDAGQLPATGFYGMYGLGALVESLIDQARLDDAEAELSRIGASERPTAITYAAVLHARGRLRMMQERFGEALELFLAEGDHMVRSLAPSPSAQAWRSHAALAQLALGDVAAARELAREEVELARAFGAPRTLGIALRAHGLVEGGAKGVELLREAVQALGRTQARLEHARALTDLGAALRRAGSRSEAREHLQPGLDLAHRCGASAVAQHALDELRATGARPRNVVFSGVEALTASERRVAEMAARGLANREIAQSLFVTRRTVETHLTHAYQKLNIDSREALAQALAG